MNNYDFDPSDTAEERMTDADKPAAEPLDLDALERDVMFLDWTTFPVIRFHRAIAELREKRQQVERLREENCLLRNKMDAAKRRVAEFINAKPMNLSDRLMVLRNTLEQFVSETAP